MKPTSNFSNEWFFIFDIDGTLTNTTEVDDHCFIQTYKDLYEIDLREADWTTFPDVTDWGISNTVFERFLNRLPSQNELAKIEAYFLKLLQEKAQQRPEKFKEIPGSVTYFHHLKTQNIPIALATGGWEATAKFKLDQVGLSYENIPFAHSNHHYSRRAITELAISKLTNLGNYQPDKIVYFGDGVWDFHNCQNMGIRFVGIDAQQNNKLKKMGAKCVLHDFSQPHEITTIDKLFSSP